MKISTRILKKKASISCTSMVHSGGSWLSAPGVQEICVGFMVLWVAKLYSSSIGCRGKRAKNCAWMLLRASIAI